MENPKNIKNIKNLEWKSHQSCKSFNVDLKKLLFNEVNCRLTSQSPALTAQLDGDYYCVEKTKKLWHFRSNPKSLGRFFMLGAVTCWNLVLVNTVRPATRVLWDGPVTVSKKEKFVAKHFHQFFCGGEADVEQTGTFVWEKGAQGPGLTDQTFLYPVAKQELNTSLLCCVISFRQSPCKSLIALILRTEHSFDKVSFLRDASMPRVVSLQRRKDF